jgi:nucleotide-binding universal stress UspA family protein
MASYLIVANQTLGGTALTRIVTERAQLEAASIHVVVPATDPADEQPPVSGTAQENAQRRLDEALERLHAAGVEATGEVGAADPMEAIRDAVSAGGYAGLIISTLPAGASRWVHMDLPRRAAREFNQQVEWIEARTDAANEATVSRIELPPDAKDNARENAKENVI